jgi:hypothetical protein
MITLQLELSEKEKIDLIELKGYKVMDIDFGSNKRIGHNDYEYIRDVAKGVNIDGLNRRMDDAFSLLYFDLINHLLKGFLFSEPTMETNNQRVFDCDRCPQEPEHCHYVKTNNGKRLYKGSCPVYQ